MEINAQLLKSIFKDTGDGIYTYRFTGYKYGNIALIYITFIVDLEYSNVDNMRINVTDKFGSAYNPFYNRDNKNLVVEKIDEAINQERAKLIKEGVVYG